MKTMWIFRTLIITFLLLLYTSHQAQAVVSEESNKIFLVDQTGEHWNITQAFSIGFDPDKFEFCIGRNGKKNTLPQS